MNGFLRTRRAVLSSAMLLTAGCGGGALRLQDVTPESVPALEAARAARPNDAAALTRLGVAYFRANRLPEARATLDSALIASPNDGIAAIYLGMTAEARGEFPAARAAYERYIEVSRSGELRTAARQRLSLMGRRELEYQARQALAQEAQLSTQAPEPNTIAVMPFGYTGTNEEIAPLSRGFAQLIVTDLARSRQVRVLERERMQTMLDEMRLGATERAEAQSAVRSGRLLRAGRVIQGSLAEVGDNDLRVAAAVVDVSTAGVAATAGDQGQLSRLFDIQKRIVFQIFQDLGIQLTDAERSQIEQRPTQNIQAFLAWSRGLEAEDRGDYAGARDLFEQATRIDPSFLSAQQSAQQASDLNAASTQSVADVDVAVNQAAAAEAGGVTTDQRRDALQTASNSVTPTTVSQVQQEQQTTTNAVPRDRDPTPERTNTEGPKQTTGTVVIIIRRP